MHIQTNTDNHIEGRDSLAEHVEHVVETQLARFRDRITRVEVHLGDVNGGKSGSGDKRCMMEVRPAGLPPISVTAHADNLRDAIRGAAAKLQSALGSALGKRADQGRAPGAPAPQSEQAGADEEIDEAPHQAGAGG
ncbi:HPF/RaiA family ribosome-associated protein [Coralloluteibacterium thermophilus]|uniref:HPF/RaiA family ribosome-associated protein n=1 Tax=Coralloluteibacterium thermophilum TaxID=2707049 RepID=A0ABV9NJ69_9GAMM